MSDGISVRRRKWHITIELSNTQVSYRSVVMADLAGFVKKLRSELAIKGDKRALNPLDAWVVEHTFEKCKDMLELYRSAKVPEVVSIRISKAKESEDSHG